MVPLRSPRAARAHAAAQRGASMLFALMALVVLMLGAAALVRSVDSGLLALGNLGFKQDATAAGAKAADAAIAFLQGKVAGEDLYKDDPANGYYATSQDKLDPTARMSSNAQRALIDWEGDGKCGDADKATYEICAVVPKKLADDPKTGNKISYVITRLCATDGDPAGIDCARPTENTSTATMDRGTPQQGTGRFTSSAAGPYFRVITRTVGARGTVSFTETLVHF